MKLSVVKIGGNVINNPDKLTEFLIAFSRLTGYKILVHGGGKVATEIAKKLGVETKMVEGRRITDEAMRDVVTMVYGGLINKQIVAQLQAKNCDAIGLTGADGGVILAKKRPVKTIDYGFVGDIEKVDNKFIHNLLQQNKIPVFAPLTFDKIGTMLNTNADTQASAIALAMSTDYEVNLIYCFEKKGVLSDPENDESVIAELTTESYASYKADGVIYEGMIPKLDNAFAAIKNGVKQVTICHADELLNAVEQGNSGTRIVGNKLNPPF